MKTADRNNMGGNQKQLKILIVEDFQTVRKIEADFLRGLGYQYIFEAGDGDEAMHIIEQEQDIDLVLCDWNMPKQSGVDLITKIRSEAKYDHIRFIMATSHGDKEHIAKAIEAGASGLIAKPFEAEELQEKIAEAFGLQPRNVAGDIYKASFRPAKTKTGKILLRAAHLQITDHLVLGVLSDMIASGELTPRHFELETRCYASWNLLAEAMEKETADIALMLAPIAMDMFGAGIGLRMILLAHRNGSIFVYNRQGGTVADAEFYRDKSFLIPHKLSVHHMLSHIYFEQQGLHSGMIGDSKINVAFEVAAPISMPDLIRENPNVAGFMVAEPIGSIAIDRGLAVKGFLSGQVWDNHPCCVVAARTDILAQQEEAVYELTHMLIQAGRKIELEKAVAARIGSRFLDPDGKLGVTEPFLLKLLQEPHGLKTSDLMPDLNDFDRIQRYLSDTMKISKLIDLEKFIDLRFAQTADTTDIARREPNQLIAVTPSTETPDYASIKVLLVEDSETMRKIEISALKIIGFQDITETGDGVEAIEYLKQNPPVGLIISDWNMPGKDGFDLLMWVRSNPEFGSLPFLMATSHGDSVQKEKALQAGANALIGKPFEINELKQKINITLGFSPREIKPDKTPEYTRTGAGGKIKVRIAHIQITDHLILGALQHLITEEIIRPKKYELAVEMMPGWNPVEEKLKTGQIDIALILAPIAMDLFSSGARISVILLAHKNGSIFVKNRHIQPDDKFNIYKNTSFLIPHKMSVHHILSHVFFKKKGLNPGFVGQPETDVFFEVVAPVAMPDYLQKNQRASGFMVAEPLGSKAIENGIAELEFLSGSIWDNHPCCVIAAQQDFLEKYEDLVQELTQHLVKSGQWIEQNPLRAAEVGVKFLDPLGNLGYTATMLRKVLTERDGLKTGNLYPQIDDFEWIQDYMVNEMGIGKKIRLDKFIDTRFADSACKSPMIQTITPPVDNLQWLQKIAAEISSAEKKRFDKLYDQLVLIRNEYQSQVKEAETLSPFIIAGLNQLINQFKLWNQKLSRWKMPADNTTAVQNSIETVETAELLEELSVLVFIHGQSLFGVPISSIKRIEPLGKNTHINIDFDTMEVLNEGKKSRLIPLDKIFGLSSYEDKTEMLYLFSGNELIDAVIMTTGIKDIRKVKIARKVHKNLPLGVMGTFTSGDETIPILDITKLCAINGDDPA